MSILCILALALVPPASALQLQPSHENPLEPLKSLEGNPAKEVMNMLPLEMQTSLVSFASSVCDETLKGVSNEAYRGCQTKTRSGKTCQKWTSQHPHSHSRHAWTFMGKGLGDHSYCRNPDGEKDIWCFTDDPNTRWEYCDPRSDDEAKLASEMNAVDNVQCPGQDTMMLEFPYNLLEEHPSCLTNPKEASQCDSATDFHIQTRLQHNISQLGAAAPVFKYKYRTVADLMGLSPGHRVLAWGAGCGHNFDALAGERGFEGVGITLQMCNAEWGRKNLKNLAQFCAADGANLPFPANSFDAVMSNAALSNIKSKEDQCKVVREQVLRVLRPGGCAWFGWNPESQEHWKDPDCLGKEGVVAHTAKEKELFGVSELDAVSSYSLFLCKTGHAVNSAVTNLADGPSSAEVLLKLPQSLQTALTTLASAACDEILVGEKGSGYRGCQTETRSGKTCQKWSNQSPHSHHRYDYDYNGKGLGRHNFCRNPDGEKTIWCYTDDPAVRWDYCDPRQESVPELFGAYVQNDYKPETGFDELNSVKNVRCPSRNAGATLDKNDYCDREEGLWYSSPSMSALRKKYDVISELMGLGDGYRVLDWGAGCGRSLDSIAQKRGFEAVALDSSSSKAEWGRKNLHHLEHFCAADGSFLQFPSASFDAVISHGALNEMESKEAQCNVLRNQVLFALRPGGCAWFGGVGGSGSSDKKVPAEFWASSSCLEDVPVIVHATPEHELFGVTSDADSSAYSLFLCKQGHADTSKVKQIGLF